ncbi:MAG: LysR family transcriptional regulator [Trebonia sp.]
MELRQLEYFVAVAEEANFTRAAARVHISQSGVSAQIRQLERELGQALLDRSARIVRLTETGTAFLPHARAALDAAASARQAVDELAGLVRGKVAVGMVSGCALPSLAELLAGFSRRYPGVTITLSEGPSDELVRSLRQGELDLALIGAAGGPVPGVRGRVIVDDAIIALSGTARQEELAVTELRGEPVVCLPRGTGVRAALDDACQAAGFTPRVVFEASALAMIVQLACLGLGTGIVPASSVPLVPPQAEITPVPLAGLRSRLELVWAEEAEETDGKAMRPAARALIAHAAGDGGRRVVSDSRWQSASRLPSVEA